MKRIVSQIAAIAGALSPTESRTSIRACESPHSGRGEVFGLEQLPFVAVNFESADPLQVDHNRPTRKMAFSPKRKDLALAIVLCRQPLIHEQSDVSIKNGVEVLSRFS